MKIAFGLITYNGNFVLDAMLDTIYPFASQICVAEGPVGYYVAQGHKHSTDGTIELLKAYPDPENKISVVHGQWPEKDAMCNGYAALVRPDTQFIWHVDDDECHYPGTIQEVIDVLATGRWDSISFTSLCFYGGFDRIFDKSSFEQGFEFHRVKRVQPGWRWETHRPPTILAIGDGRPWRDHAHLAFFAGMPHYSYVWPERVRTKTQYIREALAPGRCIPDFFNQVYLPWVRGNDAQKQAIEDKHNGCHDFLSNTRGPCFTTPFKRPHPPAIEKRLPRLRRELESQLAAYN